MTQANESFKSDISDHHKFYPDLPSGTYNIYYNPSTRRLVFEITTTDNFYFVYDPDITQSEDFKAITGKSFVDGQKFYKDGRLIRIEFDNVWNRENIYIKSSFVDLAYDNFLGVSNDSFIPPKTYPIVFGDQKFWIKLYDSQGNPIELPVDQKDNLIIEAIMNS